MFILYSFSDNSHIWRTCLWESVSVDSYQWCFLGGLSNFLLGAHIWFILICGNLETLKWRSFSPEGICFSFRWELIALQTWSHFCPAPGFPRWSVVSCSAHTSLSLEAAKQTRAFSLKGTWPWIVLTAHYPVSGTCSFTCMWFLLFCFSLWMFLLLPMSIERNIEFYTGSSCLISWGCI